ncbi:TetR/AcrR family transcriptional regulator [Streptomyces sp. RKAG293]|uniref:TetR/AcrR family transcriptional regulator n=1 Tax=Streptomyces sp. RKAG293 TaxID=2893403 RepID=UPI0020349B7C|nr:TetR/AcrR family transcriptional regulator [Streptomyces sp. RKAG293]MCM2422802.1 TetR family transcriptional regulator [Streptomyces sp. RKAG293]
MVRKQVVLRREEILDATVEQIKQRGIATTRVADVADALGVSSGLLHYHFATKELLVEEAFSYAAQREMEVLRATVARSSPALTRMKALLRLYAPTGQAAGWRLWIDGWSAGMRDTGLHDVMRTMDEEWKSAMVQLIQEGTDSGEFRCADPREAAWRITLFLDGLAVQLVARRGALQKAEAARWVREHVAAQLGIDPADLAARRAAPQQPVTS